MRGSRFRQAIGLTGIVSAGVIIVAIVAVNRSPRPSEPRTPAAPVKIPDMQALGLADAFEFPMDPIDAHGHSARRGTDEKTGWPLEIRHRATGMHLMCILAGTFEMGSDTGKPDEKPVHQVTISQPFYMGKYEVTQTEWTKVMGTNPSACPGDSNPVDKVSWDDCQEFIKKLNDGLPSPLGRGEGGEGGQGLRFSLPTEAQWEYACRAGTKTAWYWGDDERLTKHHANTWYAWRYRLLRWEEVVHWDGYGDTAPVGRFISNAFGLYDMAGNVWEWCEDWCGEYLAGAVVDPTGPEEGTSRVLRGGSWNLSDSYCRSARREGLLSSSRMGSNGFRPVLAMGSAR